VIAAVVLAAGEGRRFGGLKQLHPVDGRPMLEKVLRTLEQTGPEHRVVVLGARAGTILERIDLHGAEPVVCDRWDAGQAASLHRGLAALPDEADWALVVLGDGPHLDPLAVDRMAAAAESAGEAILAADYGGGRSHPVLIPRARWGDIPDRGERPVRGLPADPVDCRDLAPPGDVDYA
jgi:CTP:molybdopterin cytidylyltransferase MocA